MAFNLNKMFQSPGLLQGKIVRLEPLIRAHFDGLIAAGKDARIWEQLPLPGPYPEGLHRELSNAILMKTSGQQFPFTVFEQSTNRIVGSTRLFELMPEHKKLEIGWTWYAPAVWHTGVNLECKLLLLTHCFEVFQTQRVQLKTRLTNARSAAAIRKIGAAYEGTLRKDRVMPDGTPRDTVLFSIIDDEWPAVKKQLQQLLQPFLPAETAHN